MYLLPSANLKKFELMTDGDHVLGLPTVCVCVSVSVCGCECECVCMCVCVSV